jgi:hypothetical protein
MEQHLEELRARLEGLARELREVRGRVEALEARPEPASESPPAASPDRIGGQAVREASKPELRRPLIPARIIALVGRTLVVLGGAFLLRAITETAVMPALAGAGAGIAYAMWWLLEADRTADRGERQSAVFHGFAAVLIGYPLIWETTARFGIFGSTTAAAALIVFVSAGLAVAWRQGLGEIAWAIVLAAVATTMSLAIGTRDFAVYTLALLLLAVPVEVLAFRDRWLRLRWPIALGVDLLALMMVSAALRPGGALAGQPALAPAAVITAALALPVLYLASIGARTLVRQRLVTPFELVQATAALLVGFSGAVRVIRFSDADAMPVGIVVLLLGAACYAAAFASVDRRTGRGRNFYSYTTFAGLLVFVGSYMLLEGAVLASSWSALAVAAVALGARFDRITLKFHGAVYAVAAASVAGLLTCAFDGLLADPAGPWHPVTVVGIAVAIVAACCYAILVAVSGRNVTPWPDLVPQAIVGAVIVWSVAGMAAPQLAALLATVSNAAADPAFLAASRTATIAALSVVLAFTGRRWSLPDLCWLVYPLLVMGGIKLIWEDLRYGQPVTLFLALALYGGALIATPRLMRKES